MSPTGAKLIKLGQVNGYDLYEDAEIGNLVIDFVTHFEVASNFDAALEATMVYRLLEEQNDKKLA